MQDKLPTPLILPADFFYLASQEKKILTDTPTGEIDALAFIQNKQKFFIKPSIVRQTQLKKLIIADWSAKKWSAQKIEDAKTVFYALLKNGFSLYIEQNGTIVPLLQEDLPSLKEKCRQMSTIANMPVDLQKLLTSTTLPGFTKDGTYLLDYYRLQPLLQENKAFSTRRLYVSDYHALPEEEKKILCTRLYQYEKPEEIVQEVFSYSHNAACLTLKGHFPTTACTANYHTLKIEKAWPLVPSEDRKSFTMQGTTLASRQLREIKCLSLLDPGSPFQKGIDIFIKLVSLKWNPVSKHVTALKKNSLPHLREINVSRSNITITGLEALLHASPQLKKLNLSSCENIEEGLLTLPPNSLIHLEEINLSESNITTANLQVLLRAAPNLRKLNISNCENITIDVDTLEAGSLLHLEEIKFNNYEIIPAGIEALLYAAPHLIELKIPNCPIYGKYEFTLPENSLPYLTSLNVFESHLTAKSLQVFLRAIVQLKKLDASRCVNIRDALVGLPENSLWFLEEVNLSNLSIGRTPEALYSLAHAAPHLKKLNVSSFNDVEAMVLPLLRNLQELCISSNHLTTHNLLAVPSLEKLDILSCGPLPHAIVLPKNSLQHLKEIDARPSIITAAHLEALVEAAPSLTLLHISFDIEQEYIDTLRRKRPWLRIIGGPEARKATHLVEDKAEETNTPEEVKAEEVLPASLYDPIHRAEQLQSYTATPLDAPFAFTGENHTKNQGMLIEKLSQYILLTHRNTQHIPKLQDGICRALAHYFTDVPLSVFEAAIEEMAAWNGQYPISSDLALYCDTLLKYVEEYQFGTKIPAPHKQYLGEGLPAFLANMQDGSSHVLINPWHAIGITRLSADAWHIYDPNFPAGCKKNISYDALREQIEKSIGNLVGISTNQPLFLPTPFVQDLDAFLQEGGLFSLVEHKNTQAILQQMEAHPRFSPAALQQGLCLIKNGIPAWISGIKEPHTKALTEKLLVALRDTHPEGPSAAKKALEKSMEAMSATEKKTYRSLLATLFPNISAHPAPPLDQKGGEEEKKAWLAYYTEKLKTWEIHEALAKDLDAYTTQCLENTIEKRLIQLHASEDPQALRFALQAKATEQGRPLFYIHSPEALTCHGMSVDAAGYATGEVYGGDLYHFLQAHHADAPVLVVNYDRFSAEDMARLNTLINVEKSIDDFPLPKDTQIIGLINTNSYQGRDFYGRFSKKEGCPIDSERLQKEAQIAQLAPAPLQRISGNKNAINLFQDPNWKQILLGKWVPIAYTEKGQRFAFQEGALAGRKPGEVIEIQNGPYNDPEYQLFWKEIAEKDSILCNGRRIYLNGCSLQHQGHTIDLNGCRFVHSRGYAWNSLKRYFQHIPYTDTLPSHNATLLTPQHLHLLLGSTQLDPKTGGFRAVEGKISLQGKKQDKSLQIYVTRTLRKDQWAEILTECEKHQVRLQVQCAEGVDLPTELTITPAKKAADIYATPWTDAHPLTHTQVITSSDIDTTAALLKRKEKWDIALNISELEAADLLTRIQRKTNPEGKTRLQEKACVLLRGLYEGKKILLTGSCSPTLADQLAPLLISRFQAKHPKGRLYIITQPPAANASSAPFQYLPAPYRFHHAVTFEEKYDCIRDHLPRQREEKETTQEGTAEKLRPFLEEPLAKLQARYDFLGQFPNADAKTSNQAWENLYRLPTLLATPPAFDPDNSPHEAAIFHRIRKEAIEAALENKPYVLLLGFSGVGKTTSVTTLFKNAPNALFVGEGSLKKWATTPLLHNGRNVLFLDEATLSKSEWSQFESLFHDPPGILIEGKYYPLTPQHKVIFAGNPISYSEDRKAARLFERHGNTLVLDPLPPAVLYHDVLQPLFENQPPTPKMVEEICAHFLEVYRFLVSCSETDVLISPRELEMMALLTLSYCAQSENAGAAPLAVAKHYAFSLARNLVPDAFKAKFHTQFAPTTPFQPLQTARSNRFLITSSRKSLCQKIDEWLALRAWRQANRDTLTPAQLYSGLGSITIEGDPSVGKSDLLLDRLFCHGFQKRSDTEIDLPVAKGEKIFYLMQKPTRAALLKAFHQGAVVVIDEANSSPAMEDLLNSLLMGKTLENEEPENPGFMVIYTQNPAKKTSGRRATSTASARRTYTEVLPMYPKEEMEEVLLHKKLPLVQTQALVGAFENTTQQGILEKRVLLPSLREVLQETKETLALLQTHASVAAPLISSLPCGLTSNFSGHFLNTWQHSTNASHDPFAVVYV